MLPRQEYLGLLIGAARRRLKQAVLERLGPYRLSTQQFWVLLAIGELPGASLGAVAERQRLDLPTASRVVTTLVRRRLALLERSADDRRRASVRLTAEGEQLARKVHSIADGVRGAAVQGLSAAEQETLRALLKKVIANLDAFSEAALRSPANHRRAAVRK